MKFNIAFPIQKAYSSENYGLMILDASNVLIIGVLMEIMMECHQIVI